MSSLPGLDLEDFIAWNHDIKVEGRDDANASLAIAEVIGVDTKRPMLTAEQFSRVVALYESHREYIEYLLGEFREDEQNWRDYSYAVFYSFPQDVIDSANAVLREMLA